jgi:hypothetical protein
MGALTVHYSGDQVPKGTYIPMGDSLRARHNYILFSQRDARDIPSQLADSDLDSDRVRINLRAQLPEQTPRV